MICFILDYPIRNSQLFPGITGSIDAMVQIYEGAPGSTPRFYVFKGLVLIFAFAWKVIYILFCHLSTFRLKPSTHYSTCCEKYAHL